MKNILSIRNLILLLAVAGVSFAGYKFFSADKNPVTYMTEPARTGDIRRVINATGEVGAAQLVSVGAQVSGQIERLYVRLGQTVKKGDLIAQIDSTTQKNELDINKAKLESYRSQLEAARVALKTAASQYEREKKLTQSDATSIANLENAESAYYSAKSKVTELESQIKQAQISVINSEVNMGYTMITAPLDGTVVSIPVKEGQTVNSNQSAPTIVQVADLSRMEILMQISEGDITKVSPGMDVSYTVLSEPDTVYKTTLKSIDPGLTTLTNGTYTGVIDSNTAIYYYGRLVVDNTDGKLHIGMTVQSSITIASAEGVLMVPSVAITGSGGHSTVHVLENGVPVEKAVRTGISDSMNTEILSGLEQGDAIILSQMSAEEISGSASRATRMPPRF